MIEGTKQLVERVNVVEGVYKPEDNLDCSDGKYAAHCGCGNTGSIGVAVCGMIGYMSLKNLGVQPMTGMQVERMFKFCAELAKKYNIPITPDTVMTHQEFGRKNPKTSSAGKIDICCLPPYTITGIPQKETGDTIREKIAWYLGKI
jgi:hypothetical protein